MMKKKLKYLTIHGTKEYPEFNWTIDFSDKYQEDNIYVITGPNGYGKSMCLDVISRALGKDKLPYTGQLKKARLEFDSDDYIEYNLKNEDAIPGDWNNKRSFTRTVLVTACDEIPSAICVLDREREPDLPYIFNPSENMDDNIIIKINHWFSSLDVPALSIIWNESGEPEFRIRNQLLTEAHIKYLGSGEREVLVMLNALLTMRYENKDILLYDDLGLHMHLAVQPMLRRFIADLKPERTMAICTTHSPEVFGMLFNKSQDLYTLNQTWKDGQVR